MSIETDGNRIPLDTPKIGLVDGCLEATTRAFSVVLDEDAIVQLDDLVTTSQKLRT